MTLEELEAKVKQQEADLAKARADAEAAKSAQKKAEDQSAAGQSLIDRWKSEIGDVRKTAEELKALKEQISKGTTTGGDNKETQEADAKKLDEEVQKLQANLTEEQGKQLDAVYDAVRVKAEAGDAEAGEILKRIHGEALFRKEFLQQAVQSATSLPSSWRKEPANNGAVQPSLADTVKKLFESQKKSGSYIPPGSGSGANTGGRGSPKKVQVEVSADSWSNKFFPGRFKVASGS